MNVHCVLDLFSAAAGGWSLGLHRAGFRTVAACEFVAWRRALYAENNPDALLYDDVRTLTGERLLADLGYVPRIVAGSPPCQDISGANAKGKGVEGERSGLYFEAIRIVGELQQRGGAHWVALENSANLRTRGADRVLCALEDLGYACWPLMVRARDVGAPHQRDRSWILACDVERVVEHASGLGHERGGARRHGSHGHAGLPAAPGDAADTDEAGPADGRMVAGVRPAQVAVAGRDHGPGDQRPTRAEPEAGLVGHGGGAGRAADEPWADWNGGLAGHLRVDDGLSAWVAGARVALGDGKGASAASLIVEAFGDAVVPQIPEAIGRAILNTEAALAAIYGRAVA